ncbi:MAG: DUF4129 domain-containing protein [Chloroflexota bacterium]|nr:DUF4129 domain-containing protein [Chloroflexota bacterium]MDQ5867044.1 DUF4129 domain-containing protein [Chloroflexota bacterium]
MKRRGKNRMQRGWLLAAGVTVALLALFGAWFFFAGPGAGGGTNPVAAPTPLPRPALGKRVTYEEYQAAVRTSLDAVRAARSAEAGSVERKDHIEAAVTELEGVEGAGVAPAGGGQASEAQVDNTSAIEELRSAEVNLEAVESYLDTLSASLELGAAAYLPGTLEGEAAEARLREVLSDQAFNYEEQLSPLQRFMQWLSEWLSQFTGSSDPDSNLGRLLMSLTAGLAAGCLTFLASDRIRNRWLRLGLSVLVGALVSSLFFVGLEQLNTTFMVLAVVGLIVAAVAMGLFTLGLNRGTTATSSPRSISDLAAVLGMNSVEAKRRAQVSAAEADFRSAIRYRCLAVLLVLDEAGKLAFDRSATNREYLFRAPGTLHDELQPLLDRFDDVWYGNSPTDAEEWSRYSAQADRVEALVGGPVGRAA